MKCSIIGRRLKTAMPGFYWLLYSFQLNIYFVFVFVLSLKLVVVVVLTIPVELNFSTWKNAKDNNQIYVLASWIAQQLKRLHQKYIYSIDNNNNCYVCCLRYNFEILHWNSIWHSIIRLERNYLNFVHLFQQYYSYYIILIVIFYHSSISFIQAS